MSSEPLLADADVASPTASARPRPGRRGRVARLAFQAVLGLNVGLGLAEVGFRLRDGGAFPLVNVYEADALRGVRLRPDSETRVGVRGERITTVRVNADGYRGPAWPAPSPDEVVVIGDSLTFGLGVDEHEAHAARLHEVLSGGRAVLDASVPTYGPPEYLVTMEEILAQRRPAAVVLTLNLLNDLGELDRPNLTRHTAVDGWAMRVSEATARAEPSVLRARLIERSHAAFALWRWQRTREMTAAPPEPEGGLRALFDFAAEQDRAHQRAREDAHQAREARLSFAGEGLVGIGSAYPWGRARTSPEETRVFELVRRHAKDIAASGRGFWDPRWDAHLSDFERERGVTWFGGCGGGARSWSEARDNLLAQEAHRAMTLALQRYAAWPGLAPEARQEMDEALAQREAARHPPPPPPPPSPPPPLPVEVVMRRAQELATAAHARLVVVAVPIDTSGLGAPETDAVDRVAMDLASIAQHVGAVGVDPTHALRQAGPAAYLPDGHLSAAGHDAVARAVAAAMATRGG